MCVILTCTVVACTHTRVRLTCGGGAGCEPVTEMTVGGGAGCEPVTVMMTARLQESKRFGNIIKGALADMKDLFSS